MRKYFEIAAWVAGCGFVLWLILFGSFWMVRNGCAGNLSFARCNGGAVIDWVGDLVLLGWVKNYQTLISGALAIAAGAAVLASTYLQIDAERERARQQRNHTLKVALSTMRQQFVRAALAMAPGYEETTAPPLLVTIETYAPQIATVNAKLADALLSAALIVQLALDQERNNEKARAYAIAVTVLLRRPSKFFTRSGLFKTATVSRATLRGPLEANGIAADYPLHQLRHFVVE